MDITERNVAFFFFFIQFLKFISEVLAKCDISKEPDDIQGTRFGTHSNQ